MSFLDKIFYPTMPKDVYRINKLADEEGIHGWSEFMEWTSSIPRMERKTS